MNLCNFGLLLLESLFCSEHVTLLFYCHGVQTCSDYGVQTCSDYVLCLEEEPV
jgi:hypothetical protein